ncbi:hypothetical protein GCM10028805_00810 [Spirosoma harenae]
MTPESTGIIGWLVKSIEDIRSDGLVRDAHIDQFTIYPAADQKGIFQTVCQIVNLVAKSIRNYETTGVGVYLHLDLISNRRVLKKAPKDLTELISLIDIHYVPEIIIYKPVESVDVPLNEFYRAPIRFEMDLSEGNVIVLYKEWRAHTEEEFQREINFIVTADN